MSSKLTKLDTRLKSIFKKAQVAGQSKAQQNEAMWRQADEKIRKTYMELINDANSFGKNFRQKMEIYLGPVFKEWYAKLGKKDFEDSGGEVRLSADIKKAVDSYFKDINRRKDVMSNVDNRVNYIIKMMVAGHAYKRDWETALIGGVASPATRVGPSIGTEGAPGSIDPGRGWTYNYIPTSEGGYFEVASGPTGKSNVGFKMEEGSEGYKLLEKYKPVAKPEEAKEATKFYQMGNRAADEGKFNDAIEYFKQSYQTKRHPATLYNIAKAYEDLEEEGKVVETLKILMKNHSDAWAEMLSGESQYGSTEWLRKYEGQLGPIAGGAEPEANPLESQVPTDEVEFVANLEGERIDRNSNKPAKGKRIAYVSAEGNRHSDPPRAIAIIHWEGEEGSNKYDSLAKRKDGEWYPDRLTKNEMALLRRSARSSGDRPRGQDKRDVRQELRRERKSREASEQVLRRKNARRSVRRERAEGLHEAATNE
jgi:tetratricopeptide (TPR) repeat protein